jgi:hypothetical protein
VKWAKRSKLDPRSLQREIARHDVNNVQGASDLLDSFRRNSRHGGAVYGWQFAVRGSPFAVRD